MVLVGGFHAARSETCPYGVCAHVTRGERRPDLLAGTAKALESAGIRSVRSDFDRWTMRKEDGGWDFSAYDAVIADLERHGLTLLPILYGPSNYPFDLNKYQDFIRMIVRRYGRRLPVVEIWNEANDPQSFPKGDARKYAEMLKAAYEAVKSVDPGVRVAYTGAFGVPLDWIRQTFEAGATNAFDVMNVHPYSHPKCPEGRMDLNLEKLRDLMGEYGVGDRPVWITEIGWPTHFQPVPDALVLQAGLRVARPEQRSWRIVMAELQAEGDVTNQAAARALQDMLPSGSSVVACSQADCIRALAGAAADAVVYPFNETFPADTLDAVCTFVKKGGVFVEFGGAPCFNGFRGAEPVRGLQGGAALARLPFDYHAFWDKPEGAYPAQVQMHATPTARAAGLADRPVGWRAVRYLVPRGLGLQADWIPLLSARGPKGDELVGAAVMRFREEWKGAAILCSLLPDVGAVSEETQARYFVRALGLALAEGVEAFYPYLLRSTEEALDRSGYHFGLMHADFTPKPAYAAYATFVRQRPSGSVQTTGVWHDATRQTFYPQWTRPDGTAAGMVWKLGENESRVFRFAGGDPVFSDLYGRELPCRPVGAGGYEFSVGESPVYFAGARLVVEQGSGK